MSKAPLNIPVLTLLVVTGLLDCVQSFAAATAPGTPIRDPTGRPAGTEQTSGSTRPTAAGTTATDNTGGADRARETPGTETLSSPSVVTPRMTREMQLLNHRPPDMPLRTFSPDGPATDIIKSEILVSAPDPATADRQRKLLLPLGLRIKNRQILGGLGLVLSVYRVPAEQDPDALLMRLRQQWPELKAEFNRIYRLQGTSGRQFARRMVALPDSPASGEGIILAMLDATVDTDHPALAHSKIEVVDITGQINAPTRHGTAVASLLVGRGMVDGALPGARLLAINIFADTSGEGLGTRTDWWLKGLDRLMLESDHPSVVNMSFGGGRSELVAAALDTLQQNGIDLVAAAGNDGPGSPAMFPAGHPGVVAVTSLDVDKRIAHHAPRDEAIDLAAPGVDIWAADLNARGFYASGSSFATPWVSGALALAKQRGETLQALVHNAEDLGAPGRDPVFGFGLVRGPR